MDDAQYLFHSDSRAKKNIAHSAAHKTGKRGGRTCRFQSDYLTAKQKKELNGEVTTARCGRPMSYEEFKKLPDTIKTYYLTELIETYEARFVDIAKMFGKENANVYKTIKKYAPKASPKNKKRKYASLVWEQFMSRADKPKAEESVIEPQAAEEEPNNELVAPVKEKASIDLVTERGVLVFRGNPAAIFTKAMLIFDSNKNYSIRLDFKEECNEQET